MDKPANETLLSVLEETYEHASEVLPTNRTPSEDALEGDTSVIITRGNAGGNVRIDTPKGAYTYFSNRFKLFVS